MLIKIGFVSAVWKNGFGGIYIPGYQRPLRKDSIRPSASEAAFWRLHMHSADCCYPQPQKHYPVPRQPAALLRVSRQTRCPTARYLSLREMHRMHLREREWGGRCDLTLQQTYYACRRYSCTILFLSSSAERITSSAPTCPITGAQSITYWWILRTASQSPLEHRDTRHAIRSSHMLWRNH